MAPHKLVPLPCVHEGESESPFDLPTNHLRQLGGFNRFANGDSHVNETVVLLVAFSCVLDCAQAQELSQELSQVDNQLLFHSTFDDTTDVNVFGPDNDAGWIFTAESTKRANVLMLNRCPEVSIAKGDGTTGDCLKFADKTKNVLFYKASPNLAAPPRNWGGTVSLWLKPDISRIGTEDCYPIQLTDGDWNHGGLFVRFPGTIPSTFEFGTVSEVDAAQTVFCPNGVPEDRRSVTSIENAQFANDRWTMVSFTFEDVNPDGQDSSVAKVYLNGELASQMRQPLHIKWMNPNTPSAERNAAVFLGINYVGSIDDLRIYDRALSQQDIQLLHKLAE